MQSLAIVEAFDEAEEGRSRGLAGRESAVILEFGKRVKAIRVIVNSPSSHGGIGDIYNAFLPSLTLGCGSYGHNSVSNNVTAVNLINVKRIGRRNNNMQWFKVPAKTYFEPNAVQYLRDMPDVERVTIVTDATMTRIGIVDKVIDVLQRRSNNVSLQIIDPGRPPFSASGWPPRSPGLSPLRCRASSGTRSRGSTTG